MNIKSPSEERADIYKAILSGNGFINPMSNYIFSLKHSITLLYQFIDDLTIKDELEILIQTADEFKQHTDNISGLNINSNKKIYEILDVIEKLKPFNISYINYYKLCLGSILNNNNVRKNINEFSLFVLSIVLNKESIDTKKIINKIKKINTIIQDQIFSDNLAFENIKLELSTRTLSCSLSSMIYKTKQNIILSDVIECPTFDKIYSNGA